MGQARLLDLSQYNPEGCLSYTQGRITQMESHSLDSPLEPDQPQRLQRMTLKQSSWLRLTSSWNDVGSPLIGYYDVLDSHNTTTLKSYRKCSEKDTDCRVSTWSRIFEVLLATAGPRQGEGYLETVCGRRSDSVLQTHKNASSSQEEDQCKHAPLWWAAPRPSQNYE